MNAPWTIRPPRYAGARGRLPRPNNVEESERQLRACRISCSEWCSLGGGVARRVPGERPGLKVLLLRERRVAPSTDDDYVPRSRADCPARPRRFEHLTCQSRWRLCRLIGRLSNRGTDGRAARCTTIRVRLSALGRSAAWSGCCFDEGHVESRMFFRFSGVDIVDGERRLFPAPASRLQRFAR